MITFLLVRQHGRGRLLQPKRLFISGSKGIRFDSTATIYQLVINLNRIDLHFIGGSEIALLGDVLTCRVDVLHLVPLSGMQDIILGQLHVQA